MSEATRKSAEWRIATYQAGGRHRLTPRQWRRIEHKRMLGHHGGKTAATPRRDGSR